MRFFTPAYRRGELSDRAADATLPRYRRHLEKLELRSYSLRALAFEVSLHDGRIRKVVLDRAHSTLFISLRCGNLAVGYFDVEMAYSGVDDGASNLKALASLTADRKAELVDDELDRDGDGRWVHRVCFWVARAKPRPEVSVTFRDLELRIIPRRDREFAWTKSRYAERPRRSTRR